MSSRISTPLIAGAIGGLTLAALISVLSNSDREARIAQRQRELMRLVLAPRLLKASRHEDICWRCDGTGKNFEIWDNDTACYECNGRGAKPRNPTSIPSLKEIWGGT